MTKHDHILVAVAAAARAEAFREAAEIARNFGPSRPLLMRSRNDQRITGRWEGEQAASGSIAHLIEQRAKEHP